MNTETIRARLAASVGGEGNLASFYSVRTMGDLHKRAARELDCGAASCVAMLERVSASLEREGLADFRQTSADDLAGRYVRLWAAWQHAGSRVANWFVTGPAGFPVARNNKRLATEDRRYAELEAFRSKIADAECKRARRARAAAIGAGGLADAELADLQARLEKRERRQAMMRAANAAIRRLRLTETSEGGADQLAAALASAGFPLGAATCAAMLKPDFMGRRGFADFELSNNNREIKRLSQRVGEVRAKLQRIEQAEQAETPAAAKLIGGVELREDAADDRLRLIFPGKPDQSTRAALKSRGFRWSPSAGAWQRQLTNAAREAAESILRQLEAA